MYYLVYAFLYLLSLLPYCLLYALSDGIAFLLMHVIHYRKEVLHKNLSIAFPEKSEEERTVIIRKFYRHFTDNFIETIKLLSISEKEIQRRFKTINPELIGQLAQEGKDVTVVLGHFFNWEYANQAYALQIPQSLIVVYMPLSSPIFERIFVKLRTRFKTKLVAATKYAQEIKQFQSERKTLILVGDQNPGMVDRSFWTPFFGKMSPFVNGPEKSARFADNAVLFCHIKATEKRGFYTSQVELITHDARETSKGEITKKVRDILEKDITEQPWNYLWSHNRFRHEFFPDKYKKLVI